MNDSLERRRAARVSAVIPVEVRDAHGFSLHSTRDLSPSGLFFDRAIPHEVGAHVQLSFQLPGDATTIRCAGEVTNVPHADAYGMGIRFLDLSAADASRLEAFTKDLLGERR
jgi:uncharacterized protein (TIGR02266 family)